MDVKSHEIQSKPPKIEGIYRRCFKIILITFVIGVFGMLTMLLPYTMTTKNDIGAWILKNLALAGKATGILSFVVFIFAFETFISIHTYSGWKSGRLYIGKGQSVYRTKNTILFPFFALLYGLLAIFMISVTFLIIFKYIFTR